MAPAIRHPTVEAPPWTPVRATVDAKEESRLRKREIRLRRDAVRRPDSWERFRVLIEVVDQERSLVDIADHKARYALIVLGVLNAGIFVLLGRGGGVQQLPDSLGPWLVGLIAIYAGLTFLFVLHAIDCLRPRDLLGDRPVHRAGIPGLLFWEGIVQHELAAYQREWAGVRTDQLNAEAEIIAHQAAGVVRAKYRALHRLYNGLTVLVALAALLLVAYAIWGSVP